MSPTTDAPPGRLIVRLNPTGNHRNHTPLSALRLIARKDGRWLCDCGNEWNTFDTDASALRVCTRGLKRSASRAHGGRRTRSGRRLGEK